MKIRVMLSVGLMLAMALAGCKKDKDEPNIIITPPAELRQASLEVDITGSFTDSFTIYEGSEYPDESITAQYSIDDNFLTIQAEESAFTSLIFQFIVGIPSLEVGFYSLIVGEDQSVGLYSNQSIPTGDLTLSSGILNITAVDPVPAELAGSNARYVSGSITFTFEDENAVNSVEANGSFTDVLVLMY
jgi:hypothetical protein